MGDGNRGQGDFGIIIIEIGNLDMAVEGSNFFANFVLEANTCGDGNEHHYHTDGDRGDGNFYYRGGNTNFMFLPCHQAFGYKQF